MTQYSLIGKRLPWVDAKDKVTGKALYTDDLSLPGTLCGMILSSPLPHARIVAIDVSKALKLPGVKAIMTGHDTPKINFGIISRSTKYMDEYPLAVERVRFIGEEVAAVAAIDADTALEALELIRVDYEELPAVFSPQEARRSGAPLVAEGAYNSPDPLSPTYSFGAYICEVAVNLMTGEVRVIKKTPSSNLHITNNIQISISNDRNHTRRILPSSAFRRWGFYQR